jgi:hypothetical protein
VDKQYRPVEVTGTTDGVCVPEDCLKNCSPIVQHGQCDYGADCKVTACRYPACPSGTFREVAGGPCVTKPSTCSTGDIVCTCPDKHGLWCHPACQFETQCAGSTNYDYPCP